MPPSYQQNILTQDHRYKKVSFGYGQKLIGGGGRRDPVSPGPAQYDSAAVLSMAYQSPSSRRNGSNNYSTFGNKHSKWEKVQYHGQESHYYGREGKGPGAYEFYNDTIS